MNNDIPNFNLLAIFAVVMEQGSFSQAAEHLNTNQSTISTALARLKKQVGQELFVRKGRGVVPTSYSESLYAQISHPIAQLNDVFQGLGAFDPEQSQRQFVITAPEHLQWVLLDQFSKRQNQAVSLEVYDQPDNDAQLYDELLTQKYDLMIDIIPPEHASIVSQPLYQGEFVVVCSRNHPRIQGELTEQQYMEEKHALLARRRNHLRSLNLYTNLDLSKRKAVYHGRSLFNNMMLCSQSDCLTAVPTSMALQFQERLQLQIFYPPFEAKPITNYLIWLKKFDHDPAHKWLRNELITIADKIDSYIQSQWKRD